MEAPTWCPKCCETRTMGADSICSYCSFTLLDKNFFWSGQKTESLLIVASDSFGDVFERSRHLRILTERGIKWCLIVDGGLIPLLTRMFPEGQFLSFTDRIPKFEYWTWLMDGLKEFSLGRPTPAALNVSDEWGKEFVTKTPAIGMCFHAAGRNNTLGCRFIEPKGIEKIVSSVSVNWVCLQYGKVLPSPATNPTIRNWQDTAGIISKLDAVVCVDTAVAHLCALMRKPCVILHGTAQTSVVHYLNFPEQYLGLPYKEFLPTYGGFEGGQPAWKKFIEWANKTPQWWKKIENG